jgi:plasmid stabilization system protein ParE
VEHYSIIVEPEAQRDLESIFQFISLNDTVIKAENFLQELKAQITTLDSLPFRCKKLLY